MCYHLTQAHLQGCNPSLDLVDSRIRFPLVSIQRFGCNAVKPFDFTLICVCYFGKVPDKSADNGDHDAKQLTEMFTEIDKKGRLRVHLFFFLRGFHGLGHQGPAQYTDYGAGDVLQGFEKTALARTHLVTGNEIRNKAMDAKK